MNQVPTSTVSEAHGLNEIFWYSLYFDTPVSPSWMSTLQDLRITYSEIIHFRPFKLTLEPLKSGSELLKHGCDLSCPSVIGEQYVINDHLYLSLLFFCLL
jgi:hypothetical protein